MFWTCWLCGVANLAVGNWLVGGACLSVAVLWLVGDDEDG